MKLNAAMILKNLRRIAACFHCLVFMKTVSRSPIDMCFIEVKLLFIKVVFSFLVIRQSNNKYN